MTERMQYFTDLLEKVLRQTEHIEERLDRIEQDIEVNNREWLTASEAAKCAGYSVKHFREEMLREIPHFQRDRKIMVKRSELYDWMDRNVKQPLI